MSATVMLSDLAHVVRSKNAGPYEITFDVLFAAPDVYRHVRDHGDLTPERMAEAFRVAEADVVYCGFFEPALAFKLTLLRHGDQGGFGERDTFGAQQHGPLLELRVPKY